jgi:uncharacterized protein YjbI with pentapeptide repeats
VSAETRCQWHDSELCPFRDELAGSYIQYGEKSFCLAHLPSEANGQNDAPWAQRLLAGRENRGVTDFRGIVLTGAATYQLNNSKHDLAGAFVGENVDIANDVGGTADLSKAVFAGNNIIRGNWRSLKCHSAKFSGRVEFRLAGCEGSIDLSGSHFLDAAQFHAVEKLSQLNLNDCRFASAPTINDIKIPQQTTFSRAKFRSTAFRAADEGRYRYIRNLFHANRAREAEGQFYAYEKRAHRRSLPWKSAWFPRVLSCLYDWTSSYGRSYERALVILIAVQIAFGIGYGWAADRLHVPGKIDTEVLAFTLSQVVKPFELLSARAPTGAAYAAVLNGSAVTAPWIVSTFVQSVFSVALFALFLLALRWRFRRD